MLSGSNDEIVPREHMVALWEIAIGKSNPAGDPVHPTTATGPVDIKDEDGPLENESDASKKQKGEEVDEGDTREYVEYPSVEGVQVMLSKRTKYRVWKEFENGTHSMFACICMPYKTDISVDDTCVQPGYWDAVAYFINTLVPLETEL
jgi:hypothetical protein